MKKMISCVAVLLAGLVSSASAVDHVPASTLSSMGFSAAQQLSDNDGMTVRGKGTSASVWGASTATKGSSTSTNGYAAAASHHHGDSTANGTNLSFAGSATNHGFRVNVAGGASTAYAK